MSRLEQYAKWLIANEDKQGTPDFETVAKAYRSLRGMDVEAPAPAPIIPAPSTERTWGEAATDVGAGLVGGFGALLKAPGQVAKLVPGLYDVGETIEKPGEYLSELANKFKSQGLKVREQLRSKAISEAEKDGIVSEFVTAIGQTIKDPALLSTFIAEQVPQLLGPAGAVKATKLLTSGKVAAGAAAEAAGTAGALEAAQAAAAKTASRAAIGTGAVMQGADIGSDTFDAAMKLLKEQQPQLSEDERREQALNVARQAAVGAGAVSLGTMLIPGAKAIEQRLAGLPGQGRLRSALGEAVQEAAEEGGGAFAKNVGLTQIDPNQSLTAGIGAAAGLGAIGGGTLGAVLGKAPKVELLDGQNQGENLYQYANRLASEIQAGIIPPETLQPTSDVLTTPQLVSKFASEGNLGIEKYKQTLLELDQTPEVERALKEAESLQRQATLESIQRGMPSGQSYEQALVGAKGTPVVNTMELVGMAQAGGPQALDQYIASLSNFPASPEIASSIKEAEALKLQLITERITRQTRAELVDPNAILDAGTLRLIGFTPSDKAFSPFQVLLGKNISDPDQVQQITKTLTAIAQDPNTPQVTTNNITQFLTNLSSYAADLPMTAEQVQEAQNVPTVQPATGASVPVAVQPPAGVAATGVAATEPAGVGIPEQAAGTAPAGEGVQPATLTEPLKVETPEEPAKPSLRPNIKQPRMVAGSPLLAIVNNVGGIDPNLLSEYSSRYETSKKDEKQRPIIDWRNPVIPGFGRLFREGGKQDFGEIAYLLEENGYLEPGAVENNPDEASERAKQMIKSALMGEQVLPIKEQDIALQKAADKANRAEQRETERMLKQEEAYRKKPEPPIPEPTEADLAIDAQLEQALKPQAVPQNIYASLAQTRKTMQGLGFSEQEITEELAKQRRQFKEQQAQQAPQVEAVPEAPEAPPEKYSPEVKKKIDQLGVALEKIMSGYGLKGVGLNLVDNLESEGEYANKLIKVALDMTNPVRVLRHETIHGMKNLGFFSDKQWATLERMAQEKWVDKYLKSATTTQDGKEMSRYDAYLDMYRKTYGSEEAANQAVLEEAIADAFGDFDVNKAPPGFLASLLNRMRQFFAGVKSGFQGQGFDTAESVFRKIEEGKLKPKEDVSEQPAKPSLRTVPLSTRDLMEGERAFAQTKLGLDKKSVYLTYEPKTGEQVSIHKTLDAAQKKAQKEGLSVKQIYQTDVRNVAQALNRQTLATEGKMNRKAHTPENLDDIARAMTDEIGYQLQATAKTGTGLGWYSNNYPNAVKELGKRFPELKTNPHARSVFTALVAVTSNGEKVSKNIDNAIELYTKFRDGQPLVAMGNRRQTALVNNLVQIEELVKKFGTDFSKELLREITVADMNAYLRSIGEKADGSYLANTRIPAAAIYFGPKLGAFYANLSGSEGYLTMDLWWSRTFNRMRGLLIPSATNASINKFKQLVGNPNLSREDVLDEIIPLRKKYEDYNFFTDLEEMVGAKEPSKSAEKPAWLLKARRAAKAAFGDVASDAFDQLMLQHQLEKMANTIYKNEYELLEEAPFGASDRKFMYDAARRAQAYLRRDGINLTLADIQAALWYYEKRLYQKLSGGKADDIGYEEAIRDQANKSDRPAGPSVVFDSGVNAANVPAGAGAVPDRSGAKAAEPAKPSLREAPNTPEFKRWFGDSKVVDAEGKPLVVYHGAKQDIEGGVFRMEKGMLGAGAYFTSNPQEADFYTSNAVWRTDPNIIPAYVTIKRPYYAKDKWDKGALTAKDNGHDGVILLAPDGKSVDWAIPFSSEQIKSAIGNIGTYDFANPDIRYSLRAPQTEAFKRWFGNSKVVDAEGKPLVVYHGTDADISSFKPQGRARAIFLTPSPETATGFAGLAGTKKRVRSEAEEDVGQNVMPVYVSLQNPFDFSDAAQVQGLADALTNPYGSVELADGTEQDPDAFVVRVTAGDWKVIEDPAAAAYVRENFDGFYVTEGGVRNIAVFKPEQIKSATGNIGKYEPANPDIRYSLRDASWSDKRVNNLIDEYARLKNGEEQYTSAYAAFINPRDFVKATTLGTGDYLRIFEEAGPLREKDIKESSNPPWLIIDENGWKIAGHEGRHRMAGLAAAGINRAPVLIKMRRQTGDPVEARTPIDSKELIGQKFPSGSGQDVNISTLVPINWENREQLKELFTAPSQVKYSLRDKLGMYSELETKIGQGPNKAPAASWKAYINGLTQKGVKPEEIEWSGVKDWLDLQQGAVTKDALLTYLKEGGVKVEEVVLGAREPDKDSVARNMFRRPYAELTEDQRADVDYMVSGEGAFEARESAKMPKYGKYTLPGGENYREVLLMLPEKKDAAPEVRLEPRMRNFGGGMEGFNAYIGDKFVGWGKTEAEARDIALQNAPETGSNFRSSHWDQPNVLAHIRLNDRTDSDGNKVLFVEELQSDWGQEGKKKGFYDPKDVGSREQYIEAKRAAREVLERNDNLGFDWWSQALNAIREHQDWDTRWKVDTESDAKILNDFLEAEKRELRRTGRAESTGIPIAPFVTKTEGWLNLALKRVMVMAAEGGYDKVAFVNGEQSADRYDLSKEIDRIDAKRATNGTYEIDVSTKQGKDFSRSGLSETDLENMVGKEMAQRIIESVPEDNKRVRFSGLDLKVGGEGMKAFYDKIVPIAVNKLLPKVGGEKMGAIQFLTGEPRRPGKPAPKGKEQPGFSVTPEMKQKVETTGLPRFSLRSTVPADLARRVDQTTTGRDEKTFVQRINDAIGPKNFSYFRQQALNRYEGMTVGMRQLAEKMGGEALLADISAEAAALESDRAAGVTASVMGIHDRVGGVPVYKKQFYVIRDMNGAKTIMPQRFNTQAQAAAVAAKVNGEVRESGYTTVSNLDGKVEGLLKIFSPLAKYNDPYVYQLYQFWAGVKRGSKYVQNASGQYQEKLFNDPKDIAHAAALEKQYPEFVDIQKKYIAFNDELVKYMVDTGVITPEAGKEFVKHADYIPFYRQFDGEETVGPRIFQSISGAKAPKKAKGGEAQLADFLENLIRNTQSSIQAGMKNVAGQKAVNMAMDLGQATRLNTVSSAPNVVTVLENGKQVSYSVQDQLLINSMKSLNLPDMPFIGILAAPANLLRNLVTKDPGFMLANLMRDSLATWTLSGTKMIPIVDTMKNYASAIAGKSPEYEALLKAGVLGGYDYAQGVEVSAKNLERELRKEAKVRATGLKGYAELAATPFTSLWNALEKGTEASDAATRMEVYKKTLAETGNEAEALHRAYEVMNFNRKGASATIRVLTAAVPFLNARMQGLDVFYRAATGQLMLKDAAAIQKTFFLRAATMVALSCMYWTLTHDDDDYKKQEQETKDNNWLIPKLGVKIPIPFEVGVLFKVIPERIMALTFGSDTGKDFVSSMSRQLVSTLAFNPVPQTVMPLIEVATNHSFFTDRPIIGQGMENVAPQYQVGPGTSRIAEAIGRGSAEIGSLLNQVPSKTVQAIGKSVAISPMKLDHLIKGYTGTMGMYVADLVDAIYSTQTDNPKASKRFEQLPVIKRFAVDPEARGNVTDFYMLKDAVDQSTRTINFLERTADIKEMGRYMKDNARLLAMHDYVLDLEKTMKELRDSRTMINASKMSADAKRDALIKINHAEQAITKNIQQIKSLSQ